MLTPHYVTVPNGQVRLWSDGVGATLAVIAGPTRAASSLVAQLRCALPRWRVIGVEPPPFGGSDLAHSASLQAVADAVADALAFLADGPFVLAASDLSISLLPRLADQLDPISTVLLDCEIAEGWVNHGTVPPNLTPRDDGSHLNSLWSFIRDRRVDRADDPTLPLASGPALPTVDDLDAAFLAAVVDPLAFGRYWRQTASAFRAALEALRDTCVLASLDSIATAVSSGAAPNHASPPPTAPAANGDVWHQYVDTAVGRAHLRRSGSSGTPLLVLPTGGGSSAQFAPVVHGLAGRHTVVALDYFGNGLSQQLDRLPDVADLAREGFAVADALGWSEFDVWGSHTGACTALEMTIMEPSRIGRGIYEAPVMVTPEFRDDILANYFPDFTPDKFGLHLQHVWNWRRDMFRYWPWYRANHASARDIGIPSAEDLHLYCVGILQSGIHYDGAYRAGFSYDTWSRLPALARPAILTAGPNDMLSNALQDAAALVPDGLLNIVPTPTTVWWPDPEPHAAAHTLQIYRDFLG